MSEETTTQADGAETESLVPPSASYEVEGEPGVYWCAKHPKVKTRLRCGRCEKPICPRCTKFGPTGARCPDCASYKGTHMYTVAPQHYVAAVVVAIVLGTISGVIAQVAGIFALFYAPVAGTFIAKAVSTVTKHKRGTPLAVIAIAGLVLGALLPALQTPALLAMAMPGLQAAGPSPLLRVMMSNAMNPFIWVYLALSAPSVWYWLK